MVGSVSGKAVLGLGTISTDEKTGRIKISQKVDGIDIGELISLSTEAKRKIEIDKPKDTISKNTKIMAAMDQLRAKTKTFNESIGNLRNYLGVNTSISSAFKNKDSTITSLNPLVSATNVAEIVSTAEAQLGSFTLQVSQLAKGDVVASSSPLSLTDPNAALGYDCVLTIGTTVADSAQNITITPNMSLNNIVAAINARSPSTGVSAEQIYIEPDSVTEGNGLYQFKLKAVNTGVAIVTSVSGATDIKTALNINISQTDEATLKSQVIIDGQAYTRNTNTINDIVAGVNINLISAAPATNLVANVFNDSKSVNEAIQKMLADYNDLNSYIREQQKWNDEGTGPHEDAILFQNPVLNKVQNFLRSTIVSATSGATNSDLSTLVGSGIELKPEDGSLYIRDPQKYINALTNNFNDLRTLFGDIGTAASWGYRVWGIPKSVPSNLANSPVSVTYQNNGGTLQAQINWNGSTYQATVNNGLISGTVGDIFEGLHISYRGGTLNPGDTYTDTITMTQGVASKIYNQLDSVFLAAGGEFDLFADDKTAANTKLKEDIEKATSDLQKEQQRLEYTYSKIYEAAAQLESIQHMLDAFAKVNNN